MPAALERGNRKRLPIVSTCHFQTHSNADCMLMIQVEVNECNLNLNKAEMRYKKFNFIHVVLLDLKSLSKYFTRFYFIV